MATRLAGRIARDFPEYLELHTVLSLAESTWRRVGIGALDLLEMNEYEVGLIRLYLEG